MKYIEPEMEIVNLDDFVVITINSTEENIDGVPTIGGGGDM